MSCYSDRMKDTLLVRLTGAGSDAVELEMGNAAHEFFLETGAWHEEVYANLISDKATYELWPTEGTVGYICDLYVDGRRHKPVSGNFLINNGWSGLYKVTTEFGTITISPAASSTVPKGIVADVTVVPETCACEIPDDILNHYYEALLDCALGKLHAHVGRPYTNLSLASYHTARYRAHVTRARRIVAGGNVRASGPWMFPQIAPGRRRGYGSPFPRGA